MMVRTQISLDAGELEQARARANELGISLAELIRRGLRRELEAQPGGTSFASLFGMLDEYPRREDADELSIDEANTASLMEEVERWKLGPERPTS